MAQTVTVRKQATRRDSLETAPAPVESRRLSSDNSVQNKASVVIESIDLLIGTAG